MSREQQILDKLTVVIPRLQRVQVTLHQQSADVAAALASAEEMTALLKPVPAPIRTRERTAVIELAIVRSGHTIAEVSHLCGIQRDRLSHLMVGAVPTKDEREALMKCLPDWKGEAK